MSSYAGVCTWCSKPVMHKTLFGTLHMGLSPEEIQAKQAIKAQKSRSREVNELFKSVPVGGKALTGKKQGLIR